MKLTLLYLLKEAERFLRSKRNQEKAAHDIEDAEVLQRGVQMLWLAFVWNQCMEDYKNREEKLENS